MDYRISKAVADRFNDEKNLADYEKYIEAKFNCNTYDQLAGGREQFVRSILAETDLRFNVFKFCHREWFPTWDRSLPDAILFFNAGFTDPQEAYAYYEKGLNHITARSFKKEGITPEIAAQYLAIDRCSPYEVFIVSRSWHGEWENDKEALRWCKAGWKAPKEAREWFNNGWKDLPERACSWHSFTYTTKGSYFVNSSGRFGLNYRQQRFAPVPIWSQKGPGIARQWYDVSPDPEIAYQWLSDHFWKDKALDYILKFSRYSNFKKSPKIAASWAEIPYWRDKAEEAADWEKGGWGRDKKKAEELSNTGIIPLQRIIYKKLQKKYPNTAEFNKELRELHLQHWRVGGSVYIGKMLATVQEVRQDPLHFWVTRISDNDAYTFFPHRGLYNGHINEPIGANHDEDLPELLIKAWL